MRILILFICVAAATGFGLNGVTAEEMLSPEDSASIMTRMSDWTEDPRDPGNQLQIINEQSQRQDGLIPFSLIQPVRDGFNELKETVYDAANLKIGLQFHTVFQAASEALPGKSDNGWATDFDFVGTWELFHKGQPTQGEIFFGIEGRWDYGTIGPQNIGFASLKTAGGTANTFSAYDPTFILRNLYYRQGGPEAGWVFRAGKITPDSMLSTNRHISPNATFLPNGGTGMFSNALPDSGLGVSGALYFGDNAYIAGLISDSNANRFDWGDIGKGDFYKAVELGVKILPRTEKASHSKFTLWHTDGTSDGSSINANTGASGWGYSAVLSQELSADGRAVIVGRWGQSFGGAAIFDQQAAVHFLLYEPFGHFENDVIGAALNWVKSAAQGTRDETNFEAFYRFPLFPDVETTLSYQHIFNPAATIAFDQVSVFSLRLVTSL